MTGCERVLARLQAGPATAAELYELGVIAHSRISELRKKGYAISCERIADDNKAASYLYRLNDATPAPVPQAPLLPAAVDTRARVASLSRTDSDAGHGATGDPWTGSLPRHETPGGLFGSQLSFGVSA